MTKKDSHIGDGANTIFSDPGAAIPLAIRLLILLPLLFGAHSSTAGGLTLADQRSAADLAVKIPWASNRTTEAHPLGLQTLSIEKQEKKNSPETRMVRIYQYHYAHESARLLVFDLAEQKLLREQHIDTIHLPLNQLEIDHAVAIVAGDQDILEQLRSEQRRRQRAEFSDLAELDVKASIFEPMDPLHPCATQRCALLSLFDNTRTVFTTEPVVYLGSSRLELLTRQ